jgi:hypothetical protein
MCWDFGSVLPFQTRLTQTKPLLPLPNEHGSQVKAHGRWQCYHSKHKKFPYQPTHDVSLLFGHTLYVVKFMYFKVLGTGLQQSVILKFEKCGGTFYRKIKKLKKMHLSFSECLFCLVIYIFLFAVCAEYLFGTQLLIIISNLVHV